MLAKNGVIYRLGLSKNLNGPTYDLTDRFHQIEIVDFKSDRTLEINDRI